MQFWTYKVHTSGMLQVYSMCYKSFKSSEIWSILRSPGKYQLASLIVGFVFFQTWILTSTLRILSPCWSQQYVREEVDTKHNVLHINFYLPLLHSWYRECEGVWIAFALHEGEAISFVYQYIKASQPHSITVNSCFHDFKITKNSVSELTSYQNHLRRFFLFVFQ